MSRATEIIQKMIDSEVIIAHRSNNFLFYEIDGFMMYFVLGHNNTSVVFLECQDTEAGDILMSFSETDPYTYESNSPHVKNTYIKLDGISYEFCYSDNPDGIPVTAIYGLDTVALEIARATFSYSKINVQEETYKAVYDCRKNGADDKYRHF